MNIEFYWSSRPISEDPQTIETQISEVLQHSELQPCHPGPFTVFLAVGGPLNTTLTGSVKCCCGQTIATFRGDSQVSNIAVTKKQQIPAQ
jgi:hypothetical protein